jgi:four helix bundle protein
VKESLAKYQALEELEIYQLATAIADSIWGAVAGWKPFERDTLGKQLVRAADSVAANIAESYGRFHYGESVSLLYYSRGPLYETKHRVARCRARELLMTRPASTWSIRWKHWLRD